MKITTSKTLTRGKKLEISLTKYMESRAKEIFKRIIVSRIKLEGPVSQLFPTSQKDLIGNRIKNLFVFSIWPRDLYRKFRHNST